MRYSVIVLIFFISVSLQHINVEETHPEYSKLEATPQYGYNAVKIEKDSWPIKISCQFTGSAKFYKKNTSPIAQNLEVLIFNISDSELRIKFNNVDTPRWEIPDQFPFPTEATAPTGQNPLYNVTIFQKPFSVKVTRIATNEVIFDTSGTDLIFSYYYLQVQTALTTNDIFGLGERSYSFNLRYGNYTIFNADHPVNMEDGNVGHNLYGTHPMYLRREASGNFHIVFLKSSSGMDVQIGERFIQYRLVSGLLDFRIVLGDKYPENVITKYHDYLGGWNQQSLWAFGYHQCRWGYRNLSDMMTVVGNFALNKIPIDVIWNDIDYMINYTDFTVDTKRYPLAEFTSFLNTSRLHYVPILDAGLYIGDNDPYHQGIARNVFIISNKTGNPLIGRVWPGPVHYVDWSHPNSSDYWGDMLDSLYKQIQFSGLWIDMNEASNQCNGECIDPPSEIKRMSETEIRDWRTRRVQPAEKESRLDDVLSNDFPFIPGGLKNMEEYTISLNATHYSGARELEYHSLYGTLMSTATYGYLRNRLNQPFPFIISRSQIFGHNRVASHWTGDNYSSFKWLLASISHIMTYNLFGVPFVGSDICGFEGNTTQELCARWYQLGSFYPFSRNHNIQDGHSQEPYALGPKVLSAARQSLSLKYSILKYYYSIFLRKRGRGTIFRPVFFEYPKDQQVYHPEILNRQFLVGEALMVAPAVTPKVISVKAYLPSDRWYDFHTGETVHYHNVHEGIFYDSPAPIDGMAPVFLRGGSIVPIQNTTNVFRSADLPTSYRLVVGLKPFDEQKLKAQGFVAAIAKFSDDFYVQDRCVQGNCIALISAIYDHGDIQINFTKENDATVLDPVFVDSVDLLGLDCIHSQVGEVSVSNAYILNDGLSQVANAKVETVDHRIRVHFEQALEAREGGSIAFKVSVDCERRSFLSKE